MSIKVDELPVEITPKLLDSGYEAGQVLFTPIKLTFVTYPRHSSAILRQIGVFWSIASAPSISLYFFAKKPEGWGEAGNVPAHTFDERGTLVGEWTINEQVPYSTMPGDNELNNSYALTTGLLAVLAATGGEVYFTGIINEAYSAALDGKLKITLNIDKRG